MPNQTGEDAAPAMMSLATEERKQRKKMQNRINQRARRLRMEGQVRDSDKTHHRPYQVKRWRVSYPEATPTIGESSNARTDTPLHLERRRPSGTLKCNCLEIESWPFERESPSRDHLLNLIHFNVLRGMIGNKRALAALTKYFTVGNTPEEPPMPFVEDVYPGRAVMVPTASGLPANLQPTKLQISTEHSIWIDLMPFPNMRDNLIRWEAHYDHADLAGDVIGELLDLTWFFKPQGKVQPVVSKIQTTEQDDDDDETNEARGGLILWGEPHVTASWEVTTGFLEKWGWALEGCQEVIESSNRWRLRRGEKPLVVAV